MTLQLLFIIICLAYTTANVVLVDGSNTDYNVKLISVQGGELRLRLELTKSHVAYEDNISSKDVLEASQGIIQTVDDLENVILASLNETDDHASFTVVEEEHVAKIRFTINVLKRERLMELGLRAVEKHTIDSLQRLVMDLKSDLTKSKDRIKQLEAKKKRVWRIYAWRRY
mmetsp:Transcript_8857/g.9830  ORF Transcript_8857/g.9830 Transcript_8857/m.9830 type:complete len:171 (+) Transcript_8857:17-529(+)